MTRYVGEPSQERKAVQGRWGVEDLRRRPAPVSGAAEPIEWARVDSATDLGTGLTQIDWDDFITPWDVGFDDSVPTFNITAGGDIQIGKAGSYLFEFKATGWSFATNAISVIRTKFHRGVGSGLVYTPSMALASGEFHYTLGYFDNGTDVFRLDEQQPLAWWHVLLPQEQIDDAGIPTFDFSVQLMQDDVGTATSNPFFNCLMQRLGPLWPSETV